MYMLALQRYNFNVIYKPGKELIVADALSRACTQTSGNDDLDINDEICVVTQPNISDEYWEKIREYTKNDDELQKLSNVFLQGWPINKKILHNSVRPYVKFKSELTVENGIIFKSNRCIISTKLRKTILEKIHYSHS
jgi:hypothetical protein